LNGELTVDELRKREATVFGSADEKIGRSKVSLSISHNLEPELPSFNAVGEKVKVAGKSFSINILDYLAYGCHEYVKGKGTVYNRFCFQPDSSFDLLLNLRNKTAEDSILDALCALSLFGGLGSRNRNGFGKIWVEGLSDRIPGVNKKLLEGPLASYTAGSDVTRLFRTNSSFMTWSEALNELGLIYRSLRTSLEARHRFKKRVLISQPIIERKRDVREMFLKRHAKYIFLSVIPEKERFKGQILVMPYSFLSGIDQLGNKNKLNDILAENYKGIDPSRLQEDHQRSYKEVYEEVNNFFEQRLSPVQ